MSRITFEEDPFSRKVMMVLLMVQVAAMVIVVGLSTIDLFSLALAISFLTFIIFVAIIIWLYSRYRNIPIVREKSELERLILKFQRSIQTEGNIIQVATKERGDLFQAGKSENNATLKKLQQDHFQNGLADSTIKDAAIPGVGPRLKERLASYGIVNAAHISNKISELPGFGEAKRQALMNWQTLVMTKLESTKPARLTNEQFESIKHKYQDLHHKNDAAANNARASRQVLQYELNSLKPRLRQLDSITFVAYAGRSLASRRIVAALVAFLLIMTQVVSSVSATTSSIIASIPTVTSTATATLTPTNTFTPTITSTSTITDTPTITFTPTITNTPTLTFTPTATRTPLPTFTLWPSNTPLIPVSGGGSNGNCHPSYPTVCIPPPPPDLDCGDISYRRFQVLSPDPHDFDRDGDGIGCES